MALVNSPEANLANLIIKRNNLQPGFDIKKLLNIYADLRFEEIPNGVDGISINLKSKQNRPIVFISTKIPNVRQTFTMAHELGHIIIPWHIGAIVSHTNENHDYTNSLYHDCEVEANRFAAELLMPSKWVESLFNGNEPAKVFDKVRTTAGTSHISTFYSVASKLPTEYVGVLTDANDLVTNVLTNNSRLKRHELKKPIQDQAVFKSAAEIQSSNFSQNKIYWLKYDTTKAMPITNDIRSWREVLYPIIDELNLDKKLILRVSSCLSNLNKPNVMHDEFFQNALLRLSSDDTFFELSQHADFKVYLVKKIDELIQNRKNNTN
jgi:IrrE N-terminal-like domain